MKVSNASSSSRFESPFGVGVFDHARDYLPSGIQVDANTDEVNVSRDGILFTEALRAARNAPDIRADKVAELRSKIANGTYEVDAALLAGKIVREDVDLFI